MPIDWRKKATAFFFPNLSRGWVVDASCMLLVLAGCAIDLNTDPAYSPLPFFVLPIIYVAWFSPRQMTSWVCVALMTSSDFIVAYSDDFRISSVEGYSIVTQIATVMLVYWTVRQLRASAINLRDAKSRLESLNREKDLLFGVISHDLRGALGVMLASSRLMHRGERLRDDPDPDDCGPQQDGSRKIPHDPGGSAGMVALADGRYHPQNPGGARCAGCGRLRGSGR